MSAAFSPARLHLRQMCARPVDRYGKTSAQPKINLMTRGRASSGVLGGRLMFNHVNHPRHPETIADLAETLRPEGFLPVHFDLPLCGKVIKPAPPFCYILGIKHQRKAGIMRRSNALASLIMISLPAMRMLAWAIAVSGKRIPDGQPSSLSGAEGAFHRS
nr:Uncharacterised protein [Salmonella sp. NCTC 7297]